MTFRHALALALLAAFLGMAGTPAVLAQAPVPGPSLDAADERAETLAAPRLVPGAGGGYSLSADFQVPLTPSLQDALERGVPLYFTAEFELRRPRWWWIDELVVERSVTWRLAYHALTRQYRLSQGGIIQPFDSIDEALRTLARQRGWRVVEDAEVEPGVTYDAQVRLRLDTAQLPKPFQIGGLTSRDWNPQAEWKRFTFTPPTPKNAR